jgi:hypothetical protein
MHDHERPIDTIFRQYGVADAFSLQRFVTSIDQALMKSRAWSYNNPELLHTKIVRQLEILDRSGVTDEENEWVDEIIWLWYHHATSQALFPCRDREQAKIFAVKALEYQMRSLDHPNPITWLLYLLANERVEEASEWVSSMVRQNNGDKETAQGVLDDYKTHPLSS